MIKIFNSSSRVELRCIEFFVAALSLGKMGLDHGRACTFVLSIHWHCHQLHFSGSTCFLRNDHDEPWGIKTDVKLQDHQVELSTSPCGATQQTKRKNPLGPQSSLLGSSSSSASAGAKQPYLLILPGRLSDASWPKCKFSKRIFLLKLSIAEFANARCIWGSIFSAKDLAILSQSPNLTWSKLCGTISAWSPPELFYLYIFAAYVVYQWYTSILCTMLYIHLTVYLHRFNTIQGKPMFDTSTIGPSLRSPNCWEASDECSHMAQACRGGLSGKGTVSCSLGGPLAQWASDCPNLSSEFWCHSADLLDVSRAVGESKCTVYCIYHWICWTVIQSCACSREAYPNDSFAHKSNHIATCLLAYYPTSNLWQIASSRCLRG